MFTKTKRIYEVLAYLTVDTSEPYTRDTSTRKADALRVARGWATKYGRVEVNALYVSVDDENDAQGADLVAAWENGTKTTK